MKGTGVPRNTASGMRGLSISATGHKPERTRARDGWSGRFASFNFTFFANDLKNDKGDIAFIVFL